MGKGTPINIHPGNVAFREAIAKNHDRYDNEAEGKKYLIAREIVDGFYSQGSRFLKKIPTSDEWVEVPKKRAWAKAQQTLRDGAPKRRQKKIAAMKEAKKCYEEPDVPPCSSAWRPIQAPLASFQTPLRPIIIPSTMPTCRNSTIKTKDGLAQQDRSVESSPTPVGKGYFRPATPLSPTSTMDLGMESLTIDPISDLDIDLDFLSSLDCCVEEEDLLMSGDSQLSLSDFAGVEYCL